MYAIFVIKIKTKICQQTMKIIFKLAKKEAKNSHLSNYEWLDLNECPDERKLLLFLRLNSLNVNRVISYL